MSITIEDVVAEPADIWRDDENPYRAPTRGVHIDSFESEVVPNGPQVTVEDESGGTTTITRLPGGGTIQIDDVTGTPVAAGDEARELARQSAIMEDDENPYSAQY